MLPILRNDDAEALILDIRVGRNAAIQELGDQAGAFLTFPTSVVMAGPTSGQAVYPMHCDAEPGTLVTSAGAAQVEGVVAGVSVTGAFHWALGDVVAPAARYRFRRRGHDLAPPPWAGQLPASQTLRRIGPTKLARQQVRLQRRAGAAEHWLLTLSEQVMRQFCHGPIRLAIRYRPQMDDDDVVQRGLQAACRLLPIYASQDRPPCSWLGMLRLDGHRDMHREVSRMDWLPADASAALTLAQACGVRRQSDPAATWSALVTAADQLGRSMPRISAARLDAALRAPALVAPDLAGTTIPGPESGLDDGRDLAAAVARLVTKDAQLIALAGAGDPDAIDQVGDQVVLRLGDRKESPPMVRHRCWEEFRRSGELFASAAGRARFGGALEPASLAAVDECLRRAAGVGPFPLDR